MKGTASSQWSDFGDRLLAIEEGCNMYLLCVEFGCQVGAESPLERGRRFR